MSDISSAGSNGKTCRQDVLRGVDVPVVPGAAGRALPCPGAEGEFREQVPAGGAGLAARVEPADHDQVPPGPGRLVLELRRKCPSRSPRSPWRATGCGPCSSRPGPRSRSRRGRGPAGPRCGAGSRPGRRGPCGGRGRPWPWPWPGWPSLAGSGPGAAGSGPGCVPAGPGCAGLRIFFPSEVTAKSLMPRSTPTTAPAAGSGAGSGTSTAKETYQRPHGSRETVTVRRVERRRVDVRPGPGERQRRARLGEEQLPVAVPEPRAGVLGALPPAAGLVPGVGGAPGEEAGERGLLVADRLLQRDAGHLVQPAEVLGGLHGGQVGAGLGVTRAGVLVAVAGLPPGQGAVPDHADAAERAVQHAHLFGVGVGPALVCRTHV